MKASDGAKVIIIGGKKAVSQKVADQVEDIGGIEVERIAGKTRFETSEKILEYGLGMGEGRWNEFCIVVSGDTYPDALSASSFGYAAKAPIILAHKGELSSSTVDIAKGKFEYFILVGGQKAVNSNYVLDDLESNGEDYVIIRGKDRYETSRSFSEWATYGDYGGEWRYDGVVEGEKKLLNIQFDISHITFVSGNNFPDALAAVSYAGPVKGPILLVDNNGGPEEIGKYQEFYSWKKISHPVIVGGTAALSTSIENRINEYLNMYLQHEIY
ncbi:MAG: cell wall-binding repeat-containing protein [Coriobacteriales bacterium]|jgi:putative cell wall-binding protein